MRLVRAAAVTAAVTLALAGCQAQSVIGVAQDPPAAAKPAPEPLGHPPGRWKLLFDDEFGGSSLNRAHWSTGWLAGGVTTPVNPAELECYDPANVRVHGGALHLSLEHVPTSCGGQSRSYTGGMVNTSGKFKFRYGFLAARLWLPGQQGRIVNWPAFWADGKNWPKDGEIDVLEGLGGLACWHFVNSAHDRGGCAPGHFTSGWHTFGADWEPGSVTYYYDGHRVGVVSSGITSAPMYLILNNATTHAAGVTVQAPATLRVDYVRVWQHTG